MMLRVEYQYDEQGRLVGKSTRYTPDRQTKSRKSIFTDMVGVGLCKTTLLYENRDWLFDEVRNKECAILDRKAHR